MFFMLLENRPRAIKNNIKKAPLVIADCLKKKEKKSNQKGKSN